MFCARCGQQIPDASEVCSLCGREATIKLAPQPGMGPERAGAAFEQAQSPLPISSRDRNAQKVGGWLLFFCIVVIIVGPLSALVEVMSFSGNIDADISLAVALDLVRAVLGLVTGIFLWNVRPVAFTLLWIYFGLVALLAVLGIIGFALAELQRPNDLTMPVRSLIYVAIWASYFHTSKRVKATFGRNL
jgi:hypothetical protein